MNAKRSELSAESIRNALASGATSLIQVWRGLGRTGNMDGSATARMRALVPDLDTIMEANKATKYGPGAGSIPKLAVKIPAKAAPDGASAPTRHPANPYHVGSMYGTILDCMATPEALRKGVSREKLAAMVAAILKRDPRLVAYGVTVVCSPEDSSLTCHRHRSCREGYGVRKTDGGWVKLVLPPSKP